MSNWISWYPPLGLSRPAIPPVPRMQPVEVLFGDDTRLVLEHASDFSWDRYSDEVSIVAYRPLRWWQRWFL